MDLNLSFFNDEKFDLFPVFIIDRNLNLCYMNNAAHSMLPYCNYGEPFSKYIVLSYVPEFSKLRFPTAGIIKCYRGKYMCAVIKHENQSGIYYSVSVAYPENSNHDLVSYLTAKLTILNMCIASVDKIRERKNFKKDYTLTKELLYVLSEKAEQIQFLISNSQNECKQNHSFELSETLNYITSYLKNAFCKDKKFEYEIKSDAIISDITPCMVLTLSFIISIVYSLSSDRSIIIDARKDNGICKIKISSKTNIKNRASDEGSTVLESILSDFSDGVFYDYFLSKTSTEHGIENICSVDEKGNLCFCINLPISIKDIHLSASNMFKSHLNSILSEADIYISIFKNLS